MLEQAGMTVDVASDSAEALRAISLTLTLVDIDLGAESRIRPRRAVARRTAGTPVILISRMRAGSGRT